MAQHKKTPLYLGAAMAAAAVIIGGIAFAWSVSSGPPAGAPTDTPSAAAGTR
jgi:hypothetical protein